MVDHLRTHRRSWGAHCTSRTGAGHCPGRAAAGAPCPLDPWPGSGAPPHRSHVSAPRGPSPTLPGCPRHLLGGDRMLHVTLWGTRGSLAVPGPETARYGGNTSCVEVRGADGTLVVLDAGTGVRRLGTALPRTLRRVDLLLTHLHI